MNENNRNSHIQYTSIYIYLNAYRLCISHTTLEYESQEQAEEYVQINTKICKKSNMRNQETLL